MANTKIVGGVVPTFFLRGIDPHKIGENYRKGMYKNLKSTEDKLVISAPPTLIQPTYGDNLADPIFALKLKNNTQQIIATTNQTSYQYFDTEGNELPSGGECDWCRKKFEDKPLGIPVKMEIRGPHRIFYLDGCTCSNECALAWLSLFQNRHYFHRDPLYMTSEQMLRYLHSLMHPEDPILRSAPDFRLHKRRRGSLDDEEFHQRKHTYHRTDNLILAPVKVQYYRT